MAEFLAWKSVEGQYFGLADPECERIRPHKPDAPYELVETSYYGFSIPEAGINCEIYHWAHPVFGMTSGGLFIYGKGRIPGILYADFADWRNYMPLPGDISDCTYEDGMTIKVVKPLEEINISYDDANSDTSLRLNMKAIMPAAFRASGGHFTQALKTNGTLVLHGKKLPIDGYFTRDRSWGDPRTEKRFDVPPVGWHVVVFNDNLAFHFTAFESPELNPALAAAYPNLANGKNFIWGYVWKNGALLGVKSCKKTVVRDVDGLTPLSFTIEAVDENDHVYSMTGVIENLCPFSTWPNLYMNFCYVRYEYEGMTAWGELQEGAYDAFVRKNYIG